MKLYPHQEEALKKTEGMNRVAYYLDMGLGKTFVGSEKMIQLGKDINLVICQKSKVDDWVDHFKDVYGFTEVYDLTRKKDFEMFFQNIGVYSMIAVINYELAWRRPELNNLEDFTLMLDESSMIQNETAKRTKFILKMNPSNVILLSGTPTAGKYERLWSQLHLLGWGISKDLYYRQYVITEFIDVDGSGFMIPVIRGYKNVDRLKQKLAAHGAIFMKTEEAFSLPEQQDIHVKVPVISQYRKFMKDRVVWVDDKQLIGDTTLTKRLYARQLCGQYNREKTRAFNDLVESTEDRLIVFYNFNAELEVLMKCVESLNRPVSVVNGSKKDLTAYEEQQDSITFIQYQAGAMGLNLQKANKVVYFTLPDKSELFEQSKKRIHRIGQDKPCFYYHMICKGSVELDILKTLKMRKDYTDELFNQYCSEENA